MAKECIIESSRRRKSGNWISHQKSMKFVDFVLMFRICLAFGCSGSFAPLTRLKTPRASESKFSMVPQPARQSVQPRRVLRLQPV